MLQIKNKRDKFLNFTPAHMKVCLEDCCAYDLGLKIDTDGLLSKYNVQENFSSFFKFSFDTITTEIWDIISNVDYAIVCYIENNQFFAASEKFLISTKNYQSTMKERWDFINIACMIYLDLPINDKDSSEILFIK